MNELRLLLRNSGFTMVYDLQQVDRTRLYRHLFLPEVDWMGDTRGATYYLKRAKSCCAADHFAAHLARVGLTPRFVKRSDVSWMAEEIGDILKHHGIPDRFIALLPGGSAEHPQKRWLGYQDLARKFSAAGLTVVTIPGPDEMELCDTLPATPLLYNNSYLDYFQLAGVLTRAAYIVGNDSGPTHIGAHIGRPGLALFGGHTPAVSTGIQHTRFQWIEVENLQKLDTARVWQKITEYLTFA
jgi:ADP-heptose:LPS heptosyltransferase